MSYEEDYERAREHFRAITMAPEEVKHPKAKLFLFEVISYGIALLILTLIAGASGWWLWAVWPDILGNLWPYTG